MSLKEEMKPIVENNKVSLLWHGKCKGRFEPDHSGTDYYHFIHNPCGEVAEILAMLIDGVGRIIFNLYCNKCNEHDVLKISVDQIFITRQFQKRLDKEGWFNYNQMTKAEKLRHSSDHNKLAIRFPKLRNIGFHRPSLPRNRR